MGNVVTFQIDNCKDCNNHYIERIYTADSFEHEFGLYCSCIEDEKSYNKKHKLVAEDDTDVTKYSQIPNWCPLLNKDKSRTNIVVLVGGPQCFKSTVSKLVENQLNDIKVIGYTWYNGGIIRNIHSSSLENTIKECINKQYKNVILEVEALLTEMPEILDICNNYDNCKVITTCDNPNLFKVEDINTIVKDIINYFGE